MSKAADLMKRMDKLGTAAAPSAAAPAPAAPAAPSSATAVETSRRSSGRRRRPVADSAPVHYTVDLELEVHRTLRLFAMYHRSDSSEVIRSLILLLDDPIVQELVLSKLNEL